MMLIKENHVDAFLSKNEVPADSVAIIASLTSFMDDSVSHVSYSYTYDLSSLLTAELRSDEQVEELQFALLPVSVVMNTSTGKVSSVKQLQTISATCIRSARNADNRMDIEVVYSGFSRTH
jgi:YD repeat-containing protein